MKLPSFNSLNEDEFANKGDLPSWFRPLLQFINNFIYPVSTALTSNLTFQDNFLCKIVTLQLTSQVDTKISVDSRYKVIGGFPVLSTGSNDSTAATQNTIAGFRVTPLGNGQANIMADFSTGGSSTATITFILLYG